MSVVCLNILNPFSSPRQPMIRRSVPFIQVTCGRTLCNLNFRLVKCSVFCSCVSPSSYSMIYSIGSSENCDIKQEDSASTYPDRCTEISLKNKQILRQYATRNAHRWFTYVKNAPGYVGSQNPSIYLITGSLQVPIVLSSHPSTENITSNSSSPLTFIRGFRITRRQGFEEKASGNQEGRVLKNDYVSCPKPNSAVGGPSLIAPAHISSTTHTPNTRHKEIGNVRITAILFRPLFFTAP